jgi:gluconolactonase
MKIFAEDLGFPEAPVLLPDDSLLCVEMDPEKGHTILLGSDGKTRRVIARTGRPNGLARDRNGNIWVAETAMRALLKLNMDGEYEVVATGCGNEKFLFLNDVAIGPDGAVYLTDSGILLETMSDGPDGFNPDYRNLKYDGRVYRIDPDSREVTRIDNGILFTNGIAFGPDGYLYANETLSGNIFRYQFNNGKTGAREVFGNVIEHFNPEELKGPDGMKFGADGNLYVCVFGQGDVTVLDSEGKVANRIKTEGSMPTNLCFGREGTRKIYVTEVESGTVQIHDVDTDGLPLHE